MNPGDLIQMDICGLESTRGVDWDCDCFFCVTRSNRVGLVITPLPAQRGWDCWEVAFDTGTQTISKRAFDSQQARVISESR